MKPTKTWILIADSGSARIVENQGPGKGLHQIGGETRVAVKPDPFSGRAGRNFNCAGPMRHTTEGRDENGNSTNRFAHDLVGVLAASHRNNRFDRLVVCAAPEMLAELRKQLPGPLKSDVVAEISKDFTRIPTDALPAHLEGVLAV